MPEEKVFEAEVGVTVTPEGRTWLQMECNTPSAARARDTYVHKAEYFYNGNIAPRKIRLHLRARCNTFRVDAVEHVNVQATHDVLNELASEPRSVLMVGRVWLVVARAEGPRKCAQHRLIKPSVAIAKL